MTPATTPPDMSIMGLIAMASIPVQVVMLLLVVISLMSWTYIFMKAFQVRQAKAQTREFEQEFWSAGDLNALHRSIGSNRVDHGALGRIFDAGMNEFLKARQNRVADVAIVLEGSRRAMRAAYQREMDALESHLNFLASAGSVSPYIGLLGTVWGIMQSFRGLAAVEQATLAAVAPGIAEALIATAIGLFAAIPAFVAYNRYSNDVDRLSLRFENFIDEFSNILQRQQVRG